MPHVLFVDNDIPSLVTFEAICSPYGFTSTCFHSGTQALDAFAKLPKVDIAVLDLEMLHKTSYELLAVMRILPTFHNVPIIACTVHNGELDNARQAGFDSFILKPIHLEVFPQQLLAIINGSHVWEIHSR